MFTEQEIKNLVKQALDVALVKFKKEFYHDTEVILEQTLKVSPDNVDVLQLLGLTKHAKHEYKEAIKCFEKALSIDSNNSENLNNIALCHSSLGEYKIAIEFIQKAIALKPETGYLHSNLGLQYRNIEKLNEAMECFEKALSLNPTAITWSMLGGCYGEKKDIDKAHKCFEEALKLEPDFAGGHVDLATTYKMKGEYEKAWTHYEHRFKVYSQLKIFEIIFDPNKKWDGSDPEGKKILVHGEQGVGDYIHFVRYVKYLKEKGAYIILHCDEALKSLYEPLANELFTTDPVQIPPYDKRDNFKMPEHDYHCSVMSLPFLLKMKNIPNEKYLFCKEKIDLCKYDNYFKIGIAWSGNPQHPNDKNRSIQLKRFSELHDLPNVKLFSLVTDIRPRQYRFEKEIIDLTADCDHMKIVDMSPFIKNFYDTATILNSLDLIITVDTSLLHLAGSLGLPVWGLIPFNPDWRWGLTGENTIWYPSMRLFRQTTKGDWNEVFKRILEEVKNEQRISSKNSSLSK